VDAATWFFRVGDDEVTAMQRGKDPQERANPGEFESPLDARQGTVIHTRPASQLASRHAEQLSAFRDVLADGLCGQSRRVHPPFPFDLTLHHQLLRLIKLLSDLRAKGSFWLYP
jgi:hypothetical protein